MRKLLILVAAILLATTTAIEARAVPLSLELGAVSQWIWRGAQLADAVTVQPSVSAPVGESDLYLIAKGGFAVSDRDLYEQFDRIELIADYRWSAPLAIPLSVRAGFREYLFPNGPDGSEHSEEAYVGGRLSFTYLSASLTVFQDFNAFDGTYAKIGVSPFLSNIPGLDLRLEYAMAKYESSLRFNDLTATGRYWIPLVPVVDAGVEAGFSISNAGIYDENKNFWGGVTVRINL